MIVYASLSFSIQSNQPEPNPVQPNPSIYLIYLSDPISTKHQRHDRHDMAGISPSLAGPGRP